MERVESRESRGSASQSEVFNAALVQVEPKQNGPLSLFWAVPGFWRLAAVMATSAIGGFLPAIYTIGPVLSQTWPDHASTVSSYATAAQYGIAIFGAPLFGMWSDGRPRKISMMITLFAGFITYTPFLFASGEVSLSAYIVLSLVTAPFVGHLSGSPVVWAWMTDVLPVEHRELGMSFTFALGALSSWLAGTVISAIPRDFTPKDYVWISSAFMMVSMLLVVTGPRSPPNLCKEDDVDPQSQERGLCAVLLSPLKLVARRRSLRLICGLAAFVTMPDVAVTSIAQPVSFEILGIDGKVPPNPALQVKFANYFSNYPSLLLFFLYAVVGAVAKRFGPGRALAIWTPLSCSFFAAPALFALSGPDSPPLEVLCGLLMNACLTIFPVLSALTALLVPASRVGEAMGAVAACKNVAALVAPLVMGTVVELLEDRRELLWVVFPGSALVMLAGAWPCALMLKGRLGGNTGSVQMSAWSFA